MTRREQVLRYLEAWAQQSGIRASQIAQALNAPEPSIRRDIQVLRRQGYNISFAGENGYRYANSLPPSA